MVTKKKKKRNQKYNFDCAFISGPTWARTRDRLIMSQML